MRRASEVRVEIAAMRPRLRALRAELREIYAATRSKVIDLRRTGKSLNAIAAELGLTRAMVINNLHSAGVRKPGKRLHDYPMNQQCKYRRLRRRGIGAEEARAAAGMEA